MFAYYALSCLFQHLFDLFAAKMLHHYRAILSEIKNIIANFSYFPVVGIYMWWAIITEDFCVNQGNTNRGHYILNRGMFVVRVWMMHRKRERWGEKHCVVGEKSNLHKECV